MSDLSAARVPPGTRGAERDWPELAIFIRDRSSSLGGLIHHFDVRYVFSGVWLDLLVLDVPDVKVFVIDHIEVFEHFFNHDLGAENPFLLSAHKHVIHELVVGILITRSYSVGCRASTSILVDP